MFLFSFLRHFFFIFLRVDEFRLFKLEILSCSELHTNRNLSTPFRKGDMSHGDRFMRHYPHIYTEPHQPKLVFVQIVYLNLVPRAFSLERPWERRCVYLARIRNWKCWVSGGRKSEYSVRNPRSKNELTYTRHQARMRPGDPYEHSTGPWSQMQIKKPAFRRHSTYMNI